MSERSTLKVSKQTWHGRLWHFWRDHSEFKNTENYRENLCHYVRVVLFWGPLSAFFRWGVPKDNPIVTPFTVLFALASLVGIVIATILHPLNSLVIFLLILAGLAALVGIGLLVSYIDHNKARIKAWWRNDGFGTGPIKSTGRFFDRVGNGMFVVCHAIWRAITFKIQGFELFFWLLAIGVAIGSALSLTFFVFALIGVAIAGVTFLVATNITRIQRFLARHRRVKKPEVVKDESAIKVGARFLVAKKHKICPFIEVED